jgi:hypothetical protein
MPPQQPDRLLDLFDEVFDFSAHFARPICSCPLTPNPSGPMLLSGVDGPRGRWLLDRPVKPGDDGHAESAGKSSQNGM